MTPVQRIFAVVTSVATLVAIVELIRRRRLREEYAFLWIATGAAMVVLASWYGLIEWITGVIGAVTVTTTLFIFALLFLLLTSVHYSMVISRLTYQVRRLAQEVALLRAERDLPGPAVEPLRPADPG